MATFKYIGWQTKDNGKVDVRVPKLDGTKFVFTDVEPNVDTIDVGTEEKAIRSLQNSQDLDHQYNYEQVS